ncbi:PREDICTED: ras-related protein Rab-34-like [Amphimedon queenslandica]|uniref:Uncharacterized protein n=1 Tax=Amphimedon queenslandica TaxID=400682 RepID=A0A1X7ULE8_AMPQE|nr:PREDICTED: ras-related protein Rab-34-like [Amphimedon queenslandica]|eukprot:XP_003387405.2 PREDICTED: ras-related protein Rab-34-like [Amphimedon queenslandica]
MATQQRSIDTYIKSAYTQSGRWAKQTQFKAEVIQYCRGIQSSNVASSMMMSSKSTKVIIIGAPGIGKTSLLLRYCQDSFESNYKSTIGVDFEVEKCSVLGQSLTLQLWDTAGAERFKGVTTSYFRGANVVVLVFDLTQHDETLEKTKEWLLEARESCANEFELFLVGTKRDAVSEHRFESMMPTVLHYASMHDAELWITSAKTGDNVAELFQRIAIISMENLVMKELSRLRKDEIARQVQLEKSTLIRIKVEDKSSSIDRRRECCLR